MVFKLIYKGGSLVSTVAFSYVTWHSLKMFLAEPNIISAVLTFIVGFIAYVCFKQVVK